MENIARAQSSTVQEARYNNEKVEYAPWLIWTLLGILMGGIIIFQQIHHPVSAEAETTIGHESKKRDYQYELKQQKSKQAFLIKAQTSR